MTFRLKIRSKILLFVLGSVILVYSVSIAFISLKIKNTAYNDATNYIDAYISENANITKGEFNSDMITVRTLAQAFENYDVFSSDKRTEIVKALYKGVFEKNPQFYALWDSWELQYINPEWKHPYGRYVENFWRNGNLIENENELKNLDGDSGDYERIKREAAESVEEPYFYSFTGKKDDEILMTSFISPILKNKKYIGIVGVDISLEHFQGKIEKLKPYENSYAFLISYDGIIVAHPNKEFINKSVKDIYIDKSIAGKTIENIRKGMSFSYVSDHYTLKTPSYFSFAPIKIGESKNTWSMGIAVPVNVLLHEANKSINYVIIIGIIGLLLLVTIVWFIAHNITQPLIKVAQHAQKCSKGDFSKTLDISRKDEIGELADVINKMTSSFMEIEDLAKKISNGNLSADMESTMLSRDGDLIISLQQMTRKLRAIISEISSSIQELINTANSLNDNSQRIMNSGTEQDRFTLDVNRSMSQIKMISEKAVSHVNEGLEKVNKTVESLKGIIQKTRVIEDIYRQTNFISVNAAVEAARAGEHGKGFAIVAKEIQKLAEQSKSATIGIDITSQESIKIAEESLLILQSVVTEIQQTSILIHQIIDSGYNGSRNGNPDMVRLKEITDENLLISKDIASNASQLSTNADVLKGVINYFKVN